MSDRELRRTRRALDHADPLSVQAYLAAAARVLGGQEAADKAYMAIRVEEFVPIGLEVPVSNTKKAHLLFAIRAVSDSASRNGRARDRVGPGDLIAPACCWSRATPVESWSWGLPRCRNCRSIARAIQGDRLKKITGSRSLYQAHAKATDRQREEAEAHAAAYWRTELARHLRIDPRPLEDVLAGQASLFGVVP